MEYMTPIGLFVAALLSIPFILCAYDKVRGTHYSCTVFGWHNGLGEMERYFDERYFDGCSNHSVCSKCGSKVMQDGQGNWFTVKS